MPDPQENRGRQINPEVVSPEVTEAVWSAIQEPLNDAPVEAVVRLHGFLGKLHSTTPFSSREYQMFRRGLDVSYGVSQEDIERFQLQYNTIETLGPDDSGDSEPQEPGVPMFGTGASGMDAMICMRAWVAANFSSQADKSGIGKIDFKAVESAGWIDDETIERAREATSEDDVEAVKAFLEDNPVYNRSAIQRRWEHHSPEFYSRTIELTKRLGTRLRDKALDCYDLPTEFIEERSEEIADNYSLALLDEATEVYGWFAPEALVRVRAAEVYPE